MEPQVCPHCKAPITNTAFFCPNCGKRIKDPPLSTTIGKQIGVYAISIFLPPFGLIPGIKYLLQKDQKTKVIGIVAIVLTIVSTILTVWFVIDFMNQLNAQINSQMKIYQGLGL